MINAFVFLNGHFQIFLMTAFVIKRKKLYMKSVRIGKMTTLNICTGGCCSATIQH